MIDDKNAAYERTGGSEIKAVPRRVIASPTVSATLLKETIQALEGAPSWVLFTHLNLDGDATGAATALYEAGLALGKDVRWMGPDAEVPSSFLFLPHTEKYISQTEYRFDEKDVLYVFLDSANETRSVDGFQHRASDTLIVNIDHHEDNSLFGVINCVDPASSSTSELLWHLMTAGGWPITRRIADCLYVGIIADTGNFAFSNTSERTHLAAADLLSRGVNTARIDGLIRQKRSLAGMRLWGIALERVSCWGPEEQFAMSWLSREDFDRTGAVSADTSLLVNQLLIVQGVRFAVLLTEDNDNVKVSFRSREGIVASATVARALGGGGHPRASGARLPAPLEEAVRTVREAVDKAYAEWLSADR